MLGLQRSETKEASFMIPLVTTICSAYLPCKVDHIVCAEWEMPDVTAVMSHAMCTRIYVTVKHAGWVVFTGT
jgi:hypothetical protein